MKREMAYEISNKGKIKTDVFTSTGRKETVYIGGAFRERTIWENSDGMEFVIFNKWPFWVSRHGSIYETVL